MVEIEEKVYGEMNFINYEEEARISDSIYLRYNKTKSIQDYRLQLRIELVNRNIGCVPFMDIRVWHSMNGKNYFRIDK